MPREKYLAAFAKQHGTANLLATGALAAVDTAQDNDVDPVAAMFTEVAEAERALKRWEREADIRGYANLTRKDDGKYDAIMRRRVKAMGAIIAHALATNPEGK